MYNMSDHNLGFDTFKCDVAAELKTTLKEDGPNGAERVLTYFKKSPNYSRLTIAERYELLALVRTILPRRPAA